MMTKEEKGFTLVEVLAALTLLGIVFIGFMTIFPQMTKFNEKTEDKLVTMNLAKQELNNIDSKSDLIADYVLSESESTVEYERYYKKSSNNEFTIRIDFINEPALSKSDYEDQEHLINVQKIDEVTILHQIHIEVLKDENLISETFTYLEEDL